MAASFQDSIPYLEGLVDARNNLEALIIQYSNFYILPCPLMFFGRKIRTNFTTQNTGHTHTKVQHICILRNGARPILCEIYHTHTQV
jgi:hypothetical protein